MSDDGADYRAGLIVALAGGCLVAAYGAAVALNPLSHQEAAYYACQQEPEPASYDGIPDGVGGSAHSPPINGYFCTYTMNDGHRRIVDHRSYFGLITAGIGSVVMTISYGGIVVVSLSRARRSADRA